jgi:hypothetical protein
MADLKVGVQVDASALGQLGEASKQVASNFDTLADRFIKSGLTAKETASALQNLGYTAAQAATATAKFTTNTIAAAAASSAAANSVGALDKALASGAVRIAAAEAGLGPLGFAFARIGSASSGLAPILAAAFPVFAAAAFIDILARGYEKLREFSEEGFRSVQAWEKISHAETVSFETLDTQIAHADEKIAELTSGKLAGLELGMKHIGDGAVAMASQMTTLFDAVGTQLSKEETTFEKVKDFFDFVSGHGLVIPNQGELAKLFGADLSKTLDTQGLEAGIAKVTTQIKIVNSELAKTPGDKQLEEYASSLIKVLGLLETRKTLEGKETQVKAGEIAKEQAAEGRRQILAELNDAERAAKEKMKIAEEAAKFNRTAIAAIEKEGAEGYVTVWREGIRQQAADFEKSQKDMAAAMQAVKQSSAVETAGLSAGPISNALRGKGIAEESAVAQAAYAQAESAARQYGAELLKLAADQAALDTSTAVGAKEFRDLQTQLDALQRLYNSADEAAKKWANTTTQLAAEQKKLAETWRQATANAAQSGFQSFNSAFLKMAAGGESFARVMQSLWTGMADSFITSVLKMAEQWLVSHVLMAAAQKTMELLGLATHTASVATQIAENKALGLSQAGLAGAGGTASWAAAPWPIDAGAPAFGAAMAAVATSFLAFEKGGIVPSILHEGEMVLPKNIASFVMQGSAAASGAHGGPGGRGGDGGKGGDAGPTFNFNHFGSGTDAEVKSASKSFMREARRELRKLGYS